MAVSFKLRTWEVESRKKEGGRKRKVGPGLPEQKVKLLRTRMRITGIWRPSVIGRRFLRCVCREGGGRGKIAGIKGVWGGKKGGLETWEGGGLEHLTT